MSLQLSFAEASAIGPREENQDALRLVTPAAELAASKGFLFAIADGVSQCADGGLAARTTLQALALDYYATPQTWGVAQSLDRLLLAQNRWLQANGGGLPLLTTVSALVGDQQGWTGFLALRTRHCGIHRLLVYREARRSHLWLHGRLRGILDAAPCVATNPLTAPENRPLGRRRLCSLPPLLSRGGHDGHLWPVLLPSCSFPARPCRPGL